MRQISRPAVMPDPRLTQIGAADATLALALVTFLGLEEEEVADICPWRRARVLGTTCSISKGP
jgi:hypothetical protein